MKIGIGGSGDVGRTTAAAHTIDLRPAMLAGHEAIEEAAETAWFRAATPAIVASTGLEFEDLGSAHLYLMPQVDVLIVVGSPTSSNSNRLAELARKLGVSALTVKRHTINIYANLSVSSRWDAATRATELGLLSPPDR
jgi:hypothetical protein